MAAPAAAVVDAPAHWRAVDLISDLHLQAEAPATLAAWRRYMLAPPEADALIILGDLFEAWVGDDAAAQPGFAQDCAAVLHAAAARRPVFFLHGNRDFLVGPALAARTGMRLLADPTLLVFGGHRWLLTHGDALCLDDVDYQRFRAQVRTAAWRDAFLARPLAEREALARHMRSESEARHRDTMVDADVDAAAAHAWMAAAHADTLVHGHTHRPGTHRLDDAGRTRVVLSDWEAQATPPRLEVLRLEPAGAWQRVALPA